MQLVSLIIPLFNEEDGVSALQERLIGVLSDLEYEIEIIIVDDGSTDKTYTKLVEWQRDDRRLVIVKLSRNWGHQPAFNAGLDIAEGDAVIFMDGDLEDPPELIPGLISEWEKGYDVVYTIKGARAQTTIKRGLTSLYYLLVKLTNDVGVDAQAGMYSLVDKKVADVLRRMRESNKSYPNLRSLIGFRQKKIGYSRDARFSGKAKQTIFRLLSDGLNALFANTYLPIRVFSIFGILCSLIFFVIGLMVLSVRITGIEFWIFRDIPGTQLILLTVLAFGSLQITFLGVLGEYIARIYEESKGRPYYVVEEIKRHRHN